MQTPAPITYNLLTSAEISCMVIGEGPLPKHFISIYDRADVDDAGDSHALSPLSEFVDLLVYPMVHVFGLPIPQRCTDIVNPRQGSQ